MKNYPKPEPECAGWHWWVGRGNDRNADGTRPVSIKSWAVLVWLFDGQFFASSACWVKPMRVSEMGGEWHGPMCPPA